MKCPPSAGIRNGTLTTDLASFLMLERTQQIFYLLVVNIGGETI